jgi:SPP1 gp7 family putative phage head morphogenesis protein
MLPKDWTPRRRIEEEYKRRIFALISKYLAIPNQSTLGAINEALVGFKATFRSFEESAYAIAARMATQVKIENARSWREAARRGSRGRLIYEAIASERQGPLEDRLAELIAENARLITSIPGKVRESVVREIYAQQATGVRASVIAEYLRRRIPQLTQGQAALVARTETSKSAMALTRVQSEQIGVEWYLWATSEDARVRPSHAHMDKVLVNWNDPPSPEALVGIRSTLGKYHAGNCPNCRCDAYPLLDVRDITWPHRVYLLGRIRSMTMAQFRELAA